ncbi:unnamed protein product, partial [marine sediment metagenome]
TKNNISPTVLNNPCIRIGPLRFSVFNAINPATIPNINTENEM